MREPTAGCPFRPKRPHARAGGSIESDDGEQISVRPARTSRSVVDHARGKDRARSVDQDADGLLPTPLAATLAVDPKDVTSAPRYLHDAEVVAVLLRRADGEHGITGSVDRQRARPPGDVQIMTPEKLSGRAGELHYADRRLASDA